MSISNRVEIAEFYQNEKFFNQINYLFHEFNVLCTFKEKDFTESKNEKKTLTALSEYRKSEVVEVWMTYGETFYADQN